MIEKQRTIEEPIEVEGIGLHTGEKCKLKFKPAPENSWVTFVRSDLPGNPEIKADIDNVMPELIRGTSIKNDRATVRTIEHVLAALAGLQIDNVVVEMNNIEPPSVDGSASPFTKALLKAGIKEQDTDRNYFEVEEVIQFAQPGRDTDIHVLPLDEFRITFLIDYDNPALGTQYTTLESLEEQFLDEFAEARTFCFLSEIEDLHQKGLIKGGQLDNAVVIVDTDFPEEEKQFLVDKFNIEGKLFVGEEGMLNKNRLRYYNEPCRHKVVDLLGDLMLLGFPIKGHIIAARSGHSTNIELAKLIRKQYEKTKISRKYGSGSKEAVLDIQGIEKVLPHRYPFLLVDKVLDIEPEEKVVAIKNVTRNEPFFPGHFPDNPIMPGVLIIEALAQAGAFLLLNTLEVPNNKQVYFMAIDDVKFRKPVRPGDQIVLNIDMRSLRESACKFYGEAVVNDDVVVKLK